MKMRQMSPSKTIFTALIMACALIGLTTASGHAALTAGTTISNQAHVTYAEGPQADSNTVNVTVSLVGGLAWIGTPSTQTVGSGGAVNYSVDLHNTGNGTTTASVSDKGTTQGANLTAGSWVAAISPASVLLYGSISNAASTASGANMSIPVDFHDVTALTALDRVMIGGVVYIVDSWTANTLVIVTTDIIGAGSQIGEVRTVAFSGAAGTLQNSSLTEDHTHTGMTATDLVAAGLNIDGNPAVSVDSTSWTTTVVAGSLSVLKYSRNSTDVNMNAGGLTAIPYGGETYYQSGIKGNTGDILEYLVVITNAGPGNATAVTMTDSISSFLSLDTTSIAIDKNGDGDFADADELDTINTPVNPKAAKYSAPDLTVYAGVGGDAAGAGTGGTITALATKSAIRYLVVIQ